MPGTAGRDREWVFLLPGLVCGYAFAWIGHFGSRKFARRRFQRRRGTSYKWLDVVALFEHILKVQDPEGTLDAVRFSMAPALARFASLEALREDSPALIIGVVTPVHPPPEASPGEGRPATGSVAMTLHLEGKVRDDPFVEQLGQFGCGFGTVERGPGFRIDQP